MRENQSVQNNISNRNFMYFLKKNITFFTNVFRYGIFIVSIFWVYKENYLWFVVGVVYLVFTFLPRIAFNNINLKRVFEFSISFLCSTHIILGMNFGFYQSYDFYDKLMHLLGSAILTYLIFSTVDNYSKNIDLVLPLFLKFTLVISGAVSLGVVWEIFEFTIDQTGLFNAQIGLQNTMFDLIFNLIGINFSMLIYLKFSS